VRKKPTSAVVNRGVYLVETIVGVEGSASFSAFFQFYRVGVEESIEEKGGSRVLRRDY
jgi:hypothetical protein